MNGCIYGTATGKEASSHTASTFVLLLAIQRLNLRECGYTPGLGFDKDNQYSARMDVTLHMPTVNSGASSLRSTPSVNFTAN